MGGGGGDVLAGVRANDLISVLARERHHMRIVYGSGMICPDDDKLYNNRRV